MAKHRGALVWSEHVDAAASSGLSKAAYCRQHGLNYKTFLRWIDRLAASSAPAVGQSLVPLSVAASRLDEQPLRLQVGTDVVLVVPRGIDAGWLGEVLRAAAC